jgi:hypothetical protein
MQGPRHWRLHAAATAVSMTVAAWFLAGKPAPAESPWIALPGFLHLAAALASLPYAHTAGRLLDRIAQPLRQIISMIILAALHLAIVTPTGIILKVFRHDPLRRRAGADTQSNWHPASPFTDLRRMF